MILLTENCFERLPEHNRAVFISKPFTLNLYKLTPLKKYLTIYVIIIKTETKFLMLLSKK